MDFSFNEEQEMLRKTVRNLLEKECPQGFVREMERDEKGYSPVLWRKMAELGWLGIPFSEKYSGVGGNILDLVVLFEEIGRVMFPSPYLSTVVLCGLTVLLAGNEKQKSEILPKIVKGDLILALALTEPSASWDPDTINVRASEERKHFIVNGTKLFIHDAHISNYLLCVARTGKALNNGHGITLFLVDSDSPGLGYNILETTSKDKQSEVNFDNVKVPRENMIGELHLGWKHLARALQSGAVLLSAQMIGAGQKLLELTLDYARTRIQFDQPIGVNQYIHQHCIDIFSRVEGSKWVTYKAAFKLNKGLPCDMEAAIAKAWTGDAMEAICRSAHQVFSGAGSTDDSVIPMYTKRGKVAQLYLGDSAYHRKVIAKQMDGWKLERPKGTPLGLWDKVEAGIWP